MRRFFRNACRLFVEGVLIFCGLLVSDKLLAPAQPKGENPQNYVLQGNERYFIGKPKNALRSYQEVIRRDPKNIDAWLNGAVIWAEIGKPDLATEWYYKALEIAPNDPNIRTALAETLYSSGRKLQARREIDSVINSHPNQAYAFILKGRLDIDAKRHTEAARSLQQAARLRPKMSLAHYWLGVAQERALSHEDSIAAYRDATQIDSYFTRARYSLARALAKRHRYSEARSETSKLLSAAPLNKSFQRLDRDVRRRQRRRHPKPKPSSASARSKTSPRKAPGKFEPVAPPNRRVPRLRVGIGTSGLGKPLAWRGVTVTANTRFDFLDSKTWKRLASGPAAERMHLRIHPKKRRIEVRDSKGKLLVSSRRPLIARPRKFKNAWLRIRETKSSGRGLDRRLRGMVEFSRLGVGIKTVNIVDLESYTQGVVSAEMPVSSPLEALKTQAVLARSHALFIRNVRKRHRAQGYHLCDGQHCQVYRGAPAETNKTRRVVNATRGRVVTYNGNVANVLYSSNCGGHTQSSGEIRGWGNVAYFQGVPDAGSHVDTPDSPWRLRQWLRSRPPAFCAGSKKGHPGHYRWSRIIPASELETRLNRHMRIGRLKSIQPLKRSRSGHLNSLLVKGSKGSRVINDEMQIRGLLGIGSQRSSLFVFDTERDPRGKLRQFVFYGGGWGHGVGLCQTGAMGRAVQGQTYAEILHAYHSGIEVGNLNY